jgi:hypothetical protein
MSVYTVHEPPLRAADALADPERFAFVRDGFHVWAFLLTPLWMLRHRLWLVLVSYLVILGVLEAALTIAGASLAVVALVGVLISVLAGLEASTLRRFTLRRRGWRHVSIVSGDDAEDAERRFFDTWVRKAPAPAAAPNTATPAAALPRLPQPAASGASDIIGLFPEPGGQR